MPDLNAKTREFEFAFAACETLRQLLVAQTLANGSLFNISTPPSSSASSSSSLSISTPQYLLHAVHGLSLFGQLIVDPAAQNLCGSDWMAREQIQTSLRTLAGDLSNAHEFASAAGAIVEAVRQAMNWGFARTSVMLWSEYDLHLPHPRVSEGASVRYYVPFLDALETDRTFLRRASREDGAAWEAVRLQDVCEKFAYLEPQNLSLPPVYHFANRAIAAAGTNGARADYRALNYYLILESYSSTAAASHAFPPVLKMGVLSDKPPTSELRALAGQISRHEPTGDGSELTLRSRGYLGYVCRLLTAKIAAALYNRSSRSNTSSIALPLTTEIMQATVLDAMESTERDDTWEVLFTHYATDLKGFDETLLYDTLPENSAGNTRAFNNVNKKDEAIYPLFHSPLLNKHILDTIRRCTQRPSGLAHARVFDPGQTPVVEPGASSVIDPGQDELEHQHEMF